MSMSEQMFGDSKNC